MFDAPTAVAVGGGRCVLKVFVLLPVFRRGCSVSAASVRSRAGVVLSSRHLGAAASAAEVMNVSAAIRPRSASLGWRSGHTFAPFSHGLHETNLE